MLSSMPMPTDIPSGHSKINGCSSTAGTADGHLALPKVTIPTGGAWTAAEEKVLLEPYTYLASVPGKGVRKLLVDALNVWLQVPAEQLVVISNIVDMLHLSSLMIDDIEDSSELRRGNPAAHHVYGVPQTINTAEYIFVQAIGEVAKLRPTRSDSEPDLHRIVNDELQNLHRGQGLEIIWRDSLKCPSVDEYIDMANKKTSGLLRIACRLMMGCATANIGTDYVPLINTLGVFFQIRDDLLNLDDGEYTAKKGFAEDLSEGKFSFPIVHGIQSNPDNDIILQVLKNRPTSSDMKIPAINYLRDETRSFQYSRVALHSLELQMREDIAKLGGNEKLSRIIKHLSVQV